jgi:heme-degrading monooxygenase HmoA
MIVRVYRAKAVPSRETEVANVLRETTPLIRGAKGCMKVEAGRRLVERTEEFVVVSLWRDLASITAFGGGVVDEPFFPERMVGLITGALVEHFEGIEIS